MRKIEVSTDTYAKIWALRFPGEETEDAILRRVLLIGAPPDRKEEETMGRILWRDDVRSALQKLGGAQPLVAIYRAVRDRRIQSGRRIPPSFEAIVRRELEYNSSDSESFQGKLDWFRSAHGIGSGVWTLR